MILTVALLRTIAALRWRGFAAALAAGIARKSKREPLLVDAECATAVARAYTRTRPSIPIKPICLRDGLTLFRFLNDAGIDSSFVIGVRLDPFAAHSWVQAGQTLLTDDLDVVAEFTPILAI